MEVLKRENIVRNRGTTVQIFKDETCFSQPKHFQNIYSKYVLRKFHFSIKKIVVGKKSHTKLCMKISVKLKDSSKFY